MELERASGAHGAGRWAHSVGSTISAAELEASGHAGGESSATAAMAAAGQNQRIAKLREQLQRNMGQGWGMEPRLLDAGGVAIAEALKANITLTALCLSGNGLRRPTATALVRSMGVNLELRHTLTDLECVLPPSWGPTRDLSACLDASIPARMHADTRTLLSALVPQPLSQLHRKDRRRRPRRGLRSGGRGQDPGVRCALMHTRGACVRAKHSQTLPPLSRSPPQPERQRPERRREVRPH